MEKVRRPSYRRYILAFIITSAIFFIGYFFGFLMESSRADYFISQNELHKLNIRSLQLQNEIIKDNLLNDQCTAFKYVFDSAVQELERSRQRIEQYQAQSKVRREEFDVIKREYILSQLNFWQISKKISLQCPESSDFVTVIYFFSDEENCPQCDSQAIVLDYFKAQLSEDILIFSIDERMESDEPIIGLLKDAYSIGSYPSIIVEDETYGFLNKEDFSKIICEGYKSPALKEIACKASEED
jgi:thiol-disulfide isomerase/thioredoxin